MKLKIWLRLEKQDLDQRIRHYSRFRLLLLLATVFGFLFSVFWLWQKTNSLAVKFFDQAIIGWILQIKTPGLINFFSLVTYLGGKSFTTLALVILVIVLVMHHRRRAASAALFSLAGSAALVFLLKIVFGRLRPSGCLSGNDCFAFPSGHATFSFYLYGLLAYLSWRFVPMSLKRFFLVGSFLGVLVVLIALSRLLLQVHYPSDLLAGFFLGGSWLTLTILLIDILY